MPIIQHCLAAPASLSACVVRTAPRRCSLRWQRTALIAKLGVKPYKARGRWHLLWDFIKDIILFSAWRLCFILTVNSVPIAVNTQHSFGVTLAGWPLAQVIFLFDISMLEFTISARAELFFFFFCLVMIGGNFLCFASFDVRTVLGHAPDFPGIWLCRCYFFLSHHFAPVSNIIFILSIVLFD